MQNLFNNEIKPASSGKKDPLTTAGGIPETKVNEEGMLEIFEPYDSDDNSSS